MQKPSKNAPRFLVAEAVLPTELVLNSRKGNFSPCPGDGCNSDQGGCYPSDASCGQDC